MTVINNIEIDDIKYCENEIKAAICNNEPIEEKLNVQHDALYGYLEKNVKDWHTTIGKVVNEDFNFFFLIYKFIYI